jgi:hypothetical protein
VHDIFLDTLQHRNSMFFSHEEKTLYTFQTTISRLFKQPAGRDTVLFCDFGVSRVSVVYRSVDHNTVIILCLAFACLFGRRRILYLLCEI